MNLLELVPKNLEKLVKEAKESMALFDIYGINIPDIKDITIRAEEATRTLLQEKINTIAHFRAIDRSVDDHIRIIQGLVKLGLKEVLIISGDNKNQRVEKASTLVVVHGLKNHFKDLKVYCGLDQYRTSLREELDYCEKKLSVGADGFFTQPFYEPDFARVYLKQLSHAKIFLGISPVLTQQNMNYWKDRNKLVFPKNFDITLEVNWKIAKIMLQIAEEFKQHTYIMPITADPMVFLKGLFEKRVGL